MDLFSGRRADVPGGWFTFDKGYLADRHLELYRDLLESIPWEQHHMPRPGTSVQTIAMPRLEAWFSADPHARPYNYSGTSHRARDIDRLPVLCDLLDRVNATTARAFNAVFANLYRNGHDSIGWHADDEPVLGKTDRVVIASLSLGATRRFRLRRAVAGSEILDFHLNGGSLFLMGEGLQAGWLHCVPKDPKVTEARINLTFRRVS